MDFMFVFMAIKGSVHGNPVTHAPSAVANRSPPKSATMFKKRPCNYKNGCMRSGNP